MHQLVVKQRLHLEVALPTLLDTDPNLQLWFLTAAAEDSCDVSTHAKATILGMRRLLKHPRLQNRIVGSFAVLEVAHKVSRLQPCAHVHMLLVTKPIDQGRNRLSEAAWIHLWEELCPLARKRDPTIPLTRRNRKKPKPNLSFVAERVPRQPDDITRVIRYCTKWSYAGNIARNYRQLLTQPKAFIKRIEALKGVTRFFGNLHHRQPRNPPPAPSLSAVNTK